MVIQPWGIKKIFGSSTGWGRLSHILIVPLRPLIDNPIHAVLKGNRAMRMFRHIWWHVIPGSQSAGNSCLIIYFILYALYKSVIIFLLNNCYHIPRFCQHKNSSCCGLDSGTCSSSFRVGTSIAGGSCPGEFIGGTCRTLPLISKDMESLLDKEHPWTRSS